MPARLYLKKNSWPLPNVFRFLQEAGCIEDQEMYRTFNNGIGMVLVIPEQSAQDFLDRLSAMKEKAYLIGEIAAREENEAQVEWV